jgi:hypothetical protein
MSTVYSRRHLPRVRDGAAWVVRRGRTELARVVPDAKYPRMWRVRSPEGRLSDMVNITWATDSAATIALAVLNRSGDVRTDGGSGAQKENHKSAVSGATHTQHTPSDDADSDLPSHITEAAE